MWAAGQRRQRWGVTLALATASMAVATTAIAVQSLSGRKRAGALAKPAAPRMVVRTVTTGVTLKPGDCAQWEKELRKAAETNMKVAAALKEAGFEVQSTRITTNPFEEYIQTDSVDLAIRDAKEIERVATKAGISLISLGPATRSEAVQLIPNIIQSSSILSVSIPVGLKNGAPDYARALEAAEACINISRNTPGGIGNFQLAVSFNARPNIPFFPVGFHRGQSASFAIGCESTPVVSQAMMEAGKEGEVTLEQLGPAIREAMERDMKTIDKIAKECERKMGVWYDGMDTSVAPNPNELSLTKGYEASGLGRFGESGSLCVSSIITSAAKSIGVRRTGYSGLMLPPLEDYGLAHMAMDTYTISDLLLYSAVCGVGLDTVPVPGNTPATKLAALYCDCASLAFRLDKPLTARLFPVVGKKAGEMTTFNSPYMCNGKIFEVP